MSFHVPNGRAGTPGPENKDKALNATLPASTAHDDSPARLDRLADISQRLLERCRAQGATQSRCRVPRKPA
jgi:hypothetical protein